jgi:hypothetical protein
MNGYFSALGLLVLTGILVVIPVIPAIAELYRKTDAQPLLVIQQHGGNIRHFSEGFRAYIKDLAPLLDQCRDSKTTARGRLKDNAEYFVLGASSLPFFPDVPKENGDCAAVIIGCSTLKTPPFTSFSKEIYSQGRFTGGEHSLYRAILGEQEVLLGAHSSVSRWAHSIGSFSANQGCDLHGRISSDSIIRLASKCSFVRLNAPRIELGIVQIESPHFPTPHARISPQPCVPRRYLYDEDFEIQPGQIFDGNIVTRGRLVARKGSQIFGSIKSNKQMVLEDEVLVTGSVISSDRVHIGVECNLQGPVIAERSLYIDSGVRLGSPERQTTVSSLEIIAQENVVIFGTLWARERGQVAP